MSTVLELAKRHQSSKEAALSEAKPEKKEYKPHYTKCGPCKGTGYYGPRGRNCHRCNPSSPPKAEIPYIRPGWLSDLGKARTEERYRRAANGTQDYPLSVHIARKGDNYQKYSDLCPF